MKHPDLKSLIWGKHMHRLLGAFGLDPVRPDPAPRLAHPMPVWFQRVAAALTLFGIVGFIHFVDATLRATGEAESRAHGGGMNFDASVWENWSPRLAIGIPGELPPAADSTSASSGVPAGRPARLLRAPRLLRAQEAVSREHRFQLIQVTAYTSESGETDETPHLTATNTAPVSGSLALSRDLLRSFTPGAPFAYGDKLLIPGVGVFEVTDTMNPRWMRKADIWLPTRSDARAWGRRTVFVTRVTRDAETLAYRAP
jgi:3D (Asp-Asp-Asp) domain-containing protein